MSEWGPWVEHDGRGMPVPVGTLVEVEYWKPCRFVGPDGKPTGQFGTTRVMVTALSTSWTYGDPSVRATWSNGAGRGKAVPIIRYRVRKPRGLTILENILNEIPEPTHGTARADMRTPLRAFSATVTQTPALCGAQTGTYSEGV